MDAKRAVRALMVLSLVDTNILVYRFDSRFPDKQAIATRVLRLGTADGTAKFPYQAILEFVAATTRRRGAAEPLLTIAEAHREAEEMIGQFVILFARTTHSKRIMPWNDVKTRVTDNYL